ncbi:MAG: hypothetical protein IKH26_11500 [Bacteroidaceae bacterium]|nr:hypothetical protein [Bacteroidaceae bacterium]
MRKRRKHPITTTFMSVLTLTAALAVACSSNNCPLDNTVTCNYYFYDSNDNPISLYDTLTVSVLLPGHDTLYTYRIVGYPTVTSKTRIDSLVSQGYKEVVSIIRHDSILINQVVNASHLELPMAYFNKADTLVFDYFNLMNNDTIYIDHDNMPQVNLPECGSYMFHRITGVKNTNAAIDKLEITNPNVNYERKENIRIHFAGTIE